MSRIQITLRPLSTKKHGRCEVEIKMFDSKDIEFFHLDQYFPTQMDAIKFINNLNNARQEMIVFL